MYPPVMPKIAPSPELNCAKTGIPIIPRIMYTTILIVPFLHPRIPPAINIASVCRVKGIVGDGIVICEHIAMSAVKSDIITISFTDDLRFDFFCFPGVVAVSLFIFIFPSLFKTMLLLYTIFR